MSNTAKHLVSLLDQAEAEITSRLTVVLNKQRREQHKQKYEARIASALLKAQAEVKALTLKSVNEVLREYQDTLERYVVDTVNGNMTGGEMSRSMRALIKRLAPEVYMEGMKEGGVRDPEAEMQDADDEAMAIWTRDQLLFVDDFITAVKEAALLKGDDKTNKRNSLLDRVSDWVMALRSLGQSGYLSAKGDMPLTMQGDDGKDSCNECQKYNGQRHRKSWWENRGLLDRPNDKYGCGRWDTCNHHFYDDNDNLVVD